MTDHTPGNAQPTLLIENARVRVTEWRFAKRDDNTGWHRHEYDYLVVPMADGLLTIRTRAGEPSQARLAEGVPYFRPRGVEHDVINANDGPYAFIEVELLENR